jgi:hypothetical protein
MSMGEDVLIDYITGRQVPNVGAEANRQKVERLLVEQKGFDKADIQVDAPIVVTIGGEPYAATVDLVVTLNAKRFMAIKCAPGSLASREREIVAAARLLEPYQLPFAAATDGRDALLWDTVSGRCLGTGLACLPSKDQAIQLLAETAFIALAPERVERQKIIFRSYDMMNVNMAGRADR